MHPTSRGRWTKKDGEITLDRAAKTGSAQYVERRRAGEFDLAELRALLDRAALYIGGDSGPILDGPAFPLARAPPV